MRVRGAAIKNVFSPQAPVLPAFLCLSPELYFYFTSFARLFMLTFGCYMLLPCNCTKLGGSRRVSESQADKETSPFQIKTSQKETPKLKKVCSTPDKKKSVHEERGFFFWNFTLSGHFFLRPKLKVSLDQKPRQWVGEEHFFSTWPTSATYSRTFQGFCSTFVHCLVSRIIHF